MIRGRDLRQSEGQVVDIFACLRLNRSTQLTVAAASDRLGTVHDYRFGCLFPTLPVYGFTLPLVK